jgi:carbon-monoxide dehydrogenase large subunit
MVADPFVETSRPITSSILGHRVQRREDQALLTGKGTYVGGMQHELLAGAAHVTFVRSAMAHARILGIDVDEARGADGVVAVLTAADLSFGCMPMELPMLRGEMERPLLARDVVRFVGEPLAVVVAESAAAAADAADLVVVDYDPLPSVVDVDDAALNAVLLFEAAGTNVAFDMTSNLDPDLLSNCEVVVGPVVIGNQRLAACPLEGRATAACLVDGRVWLWTSTQVPQTVRDTVAEVLELDPGKVRVVAPDVGGGFGPKAAVHVEEVLTVAASLVVGRAMRWTETRMENMMSMGHGRGHRQRITIGGDRSGRVLAYRLEVLADAGAYPTLGAFLPALTRAMASGVYDIERVEFSGRSVVTNTMGIYAYRGAGRPEATAAIERAIDLFAAELGMDAADVRLQNVVASADFPFTTPTGSTYDVGNYRGALQAVLQASAYQELRVEQRRRRAAESPIRLGIGVSAYVEVTAPPGSTSEVGSVQVLADGSARVLTGTSPHGQGHVTSWSMLVNSQLGIPLDRVDVVHGDTDLVPVGVGTFGSRSLQIGGTAVFQAAGEVAELGRATAARLLEASVHDVVLDTNEGRFHVVGSPSIGFTWCELLAADGRPSMEVETRFTAAQSTYPFGAHVAVVEVDIETGRVLLRDLFACDDAGTVVNPLIFDGQIHGGLAQGIAQALYEEMVYDADGNPLTSTFADYGVISAAELPSFHTVAHETPTPLNPLGAKGIGESGTIGATPAVQSAVVDALADLGVRHIDMPLSPERVWRAISAAGAGRHA